MLRATPLLCGLIAAAFVLACSAKDLSKFNAGASGAAGGTAGSATGGTAGSASGGTAGSASGGTAGSASGGTAGSASGGTAGSASGGAAGSGGGSGGGTAGAGGGAGVGAALCKELCTKVQSAGCPNQNQANCLTDCNAQYNTCKSQYDAAVACVRTSATLSCATNGTLRINGCDTSLVPLAVCTACLASVSHTACQACTAANCCAENQAFSGDADAVPLGDCLDACAESDDACNQVCFSKYPAASVRAYALFQCQLDGCGTVCG